MTQETNEQVQQNLDAAEAFVDPVAQVVLPYEKVKPVADLKTYMENESMQMPYHKSVVQSGDYRLWITTRSEKQLKDYQAGLAELLQSRIEREYMAPNWEFMHRVLIRNLMYEIELHRRRFGWDKSAKEKVFTDYEAEVKLWRARYEEARAKFFAAEPVPIDPSEEELPY